MSSASGLRWGERSPGDAQEARDRILDSARRCLAEGGYGQVTMSVIAAEANISRATLYRYFDGRDEVLFGVMARDTRMYLERAFPKVASQPDLGSAILEFIWLTLEATRRDPTIALMFESEDSRETRGILMESSVELFEMVITEFFQPLFEEFADEVRNGTSLEDASEWILRTVLSLLTVEGPRRRGRTSLDRFLAQFLLPVIIVEADGR